MKTAGPKSSLEGLPHTCLQSIWQKNNKPGNDRAEEMAG